MNCTRCGTGLPDTGGICPTCGTINAAVWPGGQQPPTSYDQYPPRGYDGPPQQQQQAPYGQGYAAPQQGYYPPQQGYGNPPQPYPPYGQQPGAVNVFINNAPGTNASQSGKNSTALIVEIVLNFFLGLYGVGWLMAGETTTGVILLICSIVLYWPTLLLGIGFTVGIGAFCLVPLAIGAIVFNAIMLNKLLERKASPFAVPLQYPPQSPPQYRP